MKCLLIVFSAVISCGVLAVANTPKYGYSKAEQLKWPKYFPECGGSKQSPIEIKSKQAIPLNIPPLKLVGYDRILKSPLILRNNGNSVDLQIYDNSSSIPYITGGNLNGKYEFYSFFFHWGKENNRGAEHVIDGTRYPLGVHIVHRNIKYSANIDQAYKNPDGFATFAVSYHLSATDGKELAPISDKLSYIRKTGSSTLIKSKLSLGSFVGELDLDRYYTYQGSLTVPPCNEAGTWLIIPETLPVSNKQLKQFRSLLGADGAPIVDNYRALQPLNNRKVYVRRTEQTYY